LLARGGGFGNSLPQMNAEEHRNRDPLTHLVIGSFFEVYKELGYGFLESVYRRALVLALVDRGLWLKPSLPFRSSSRGARLATIVPIFWWSAC